MVQAIVLDPADAFAEKKGGGAASPPSLRLPTRAEFFLVSAVYTVIIALVASQVPFQAGLSGLILRLTLYTHGRRISTEDAK